MKAKFIALFFLFSFYCLAGEVKEEAEGWLKLPAFDLQVTSQSQETYVGDQVEFKLAHNPISWTQLELDPAISLEDQGWHLEAKTTGEYANNPVIVATPLKPGSLTLSSIILKDSSGKPVGRTNPLNFEVQSSISKNDPKPNEPNGIVPLVRLKFPVWMVILLGILGILLLGLIGYGLWHLWKKRKAKSSAPLLDTRTEDEIALDELEKLGQKDYIQTGNLKKYYFALSDILRTYIGARYSFHALELTTREMIQYLEDNKVVSDSLIDRIESLFGKLDTVKFTELRPPGDEPAWLMEESKKWVFQTRRPPLVMSSTSSSSRDGKFKGRQTDASS